MSRTIYGKHYIAELGIDVIHVQPVNVHNALDCGSIICCSGKTRKLP